MTGIMTLGNMILALILFLTGSKVVVGMVLCWNILWILLTLYDIYTYYK